MAEREIVRTRGLQARTRTSCEGAARQPAVAAPRIGPESWRSLALLQLCDGLARLLDTVRGLGERVSATLEEKERQGELSYAHRDRSDPHVAVHQPADQRG